MKEGDLENLIGKGETEEVEFKESLRLRDEIGQTVSSLSNTVPGKILVGVTDSGKVREVDLGENTLEELANYIKRNTDPSIYPSLDRKKVNGKDVVLIDAEESSEKPVFFKDRAYKRVGNADHRMNSSEIRKLAKGSGEKVHWDEQVCEEASLEDIDEEKVRWYLEQREEVRGRGKPSDMSSAKLLSNIGAAKEIDNETKPTNAGVLFFGKNPQKFIRQSRLRAANFSGRKVTRDFLDREDFSGTLWEMVEEIEEFVRKNMRTFGFRTELTFKRIDKQEYPIKALEEAVINALVHRDYREPADTRVMMFDDRIEVVNPGSFPEGVTPDDPKHVPVNPILSQLMYDVGFIEKYGTGIYMIQERCEEHGMSKPEYEIGKVETKVTFKSPGKAVLVSEIEKHVSDLNQRMKKGLKYAFEEGPITNRKYREINNVSHDTASSDLSELVDKGLLTRVGKGRSTKYKPKI